MTQTFGPIEFAAVVPTFIGGKPDKVMSYTISNLNTLEIAEEEVKRWQERGEDTAIVSRQWQTVEDKPQPVDYPISPAMKHTAIEAVAEFLRLNYPCDCGDPTGCDDMNEAVAIVETVEGVYFPEESKAAILFKDVPARPSPTNRVLTENEAALVECLFQGYKTLGFDTDGVDEGVQFLAQTGMGGWDLEAFIKLMTDSFKQIRADMEAEPEDTLVRAAQNLELQPPMTKERYVATLKLYAVEPWRMK